MEKYKLANGDEYDIIRFSDSCAVAKMEALYILAHMQNVENT